MREQIPAEVPEIPKRQRAVSLLTAVLICCVLVSIAIPWFTAVAGVAALVTLIGVFLESTPRTRIVVAILVGVGVVSGLLSIFLFDSPLEASGLHRLNQDLIAMLAGGAFVRGVLTFTDNAPKSKLTGIPAVLRTAYTFHFMGAVLNMVSIGIVGDRLQRNGKLSLNNAALLSQNYSIAALWSPFWMVAALIFSYFPTVSVLPLSATGIGFAIVLILAASLWNAKQRTPDELRDPGYALQPSILALPVTLIVFVVIGHTVLPNTPVPRLVLLALIIIPFLFGIFRTGPRVTTQRFVRVATSGLTSSANESALFIAAGVFTVGGSMLTAHLPFQLSSVPPSVLSAWLLTVAIALLSLLGVHPIISISLASALALLVPEGAVLYAAAMAWGWAIAAPIGPLAGTVIYVSQRYAIPSRQLIKQSLPFAVFAIVLAYPGIYVMDSLSRLWGFS